MTKKSSRLNEEKLLDEMFVLLEYSNSFKEFIEGLTDDAFKLLQETIDARSCGLKERITENV